MVPLFCLEDAVFPDILQSLEIKDAVVTPHFYYSRHKVKAEQKVNWAQASMNNTESRACTGSCAMYTASRQGNKTSLSFLESQDRGMV